MSVRSWQRYLGYAYVSGLVSAQSRAELARLRLAKGGWRALARKLSAARAPVCFESLEGGGLALYREIPGVSYAKSLWDVAAALGAAGTQRKMLTVRFLADLARKRGFQHFRKQVAREGVTIPHQLARKWGDDLEGLYKMLRYNPRPGDDHE